MTVPNNLKYARSHEWALVEGDTVVVGISQYAQDQLGEVVYVELPDIGAEVEAGDELGTLESVKAVSEFLAPVSGEVIEINESLEETPNLVNQEPYGTGWLVKLKVSETNADLLDAENYQAFLEQENG